MGKIICDVCGTSYPTSATQCPICGCVRPADDLQPESEQITHILERPENYTYVKGGRFSKSNVQKRNQGVAPDPTTPENSNENEKPSKSDRGLVIAVCVLLLAIVAVVVYIAVHFFAPSDSEAPVNNDSTGVVTSQTTEAETTEPTSEQLACTEIVLSNTEITLDAVGATHQLDVVLIPSDTTDTLSFVSQDEKIATVSETGEIVAIAPGETLITVTCGSATAQCKVICSFNTESTEGTTTPSVPAETYKAPFKINKSDVTIRVGETFVLKLTDANGKIIPVTWTATHQDTCTIDGNSITGAAKGTTEISVAYEGGTYVCVVRVV